MRIVIFGLSISSSWGNGHATLWRGLCRALSSQGHHVTFFERDKPYYSNNRDYSRIPGGELVLYEDWDYAWRDAERSLRESDVGIVTSYCPDAIAATELLANLATMPKIFYDLDAPVTLENLRAGRQVDYIGPRKLRDFDLVLSYTGGRTMSDLEQLLSARRVKPLYGSVDPEIHRPSAPSPQYRADLSYIGTYAADRQQALESIFVEPARRASAARFVIAGAQYPSDFPWAENIHFVRHLPPDEHPGFYSSSRLTLNVTRRAMADAGYCPSGRLFEAAACGVPILSDNWPGLEEFFEPGEQILITSSPEDTLAGLQVSDSELRRIAAGARDRTLSFHTANHRASEMIQYLEQAFTVTPGG